MAAADDDVLGPAGEPDIAIRINAAQITGIQPITIDPGAGVVGILYIFVDDLRSADQHRADLIGITIPDRFIIRTDLSDANFIEWHTQPDGTDFDLAN